MRTLKKALCVVLCLVMMAGLCVIGTSAAFTDADKINYKEAVDVLTGIGVINGMGDGTFAPQGTLTRAQACKIVVYLLQEQDLKGSCKFADCQNHWAKNEIAICEAKGIVAGYGDGNFGPDDPLTGAAFGKMLLCALGYNAANEGMIGDSWELGVATLVKKLDLAKNIKGFDGTAPITREAACELAFQALQASTVTYANGGTTITAGEVTITTGASAAEKTGKTLADEFDLKKTPVADIGADAYGRAGAKQWKAGKKVIYTEYAEADWVYANKTGAAVAADKVKTAYAKAAGLKESAVALKNADGSPFDAAIAAGETYEFATSADGKTATVIASYSYKPAQVESVKDTKAVDVDYKKDIALDIGTVHDDQLTLDVKKGDRLAIPFAAGEYIYEDAVIMEGTNGVMSAYNAAAGSATIGGAKLYIAAAFDDVDDAVKTKKDFKSTLTYYTDPNGMLLVAEIYEEAFTYDAVVGFAFAAQAQPYDGGTSGDLMGNDATATQEGRAVVQILDMDGKVTVYDIAVRNKDKKATYIGKDALNIFTEGAATGDAATVTKEPKTDINKFVKYYKNDDGTIVIVAIEAAKEVKTFKGSYSVTVGGAAKTANSKTVIEIVGNKASKYVTKTITGYKNFAAETYKTAYVVEKDGFITNIYAVEVEITPEAVPATLGYCKAIGDLTGDGTEVTFVIDGQEATYLMDSVNVVKGGYYDVTVEDGKATAVAHDPDKDDFVIAVVDDGFIADAAGNVVEFAKTTNVYDISGKSLTLAKDVKVDVFNMTENVMVIFIVGKD